MRFYENLSAKEAASLISGTKGFLAIDLTWGRIDVVKKSAISELEHLARAGVRLSIDIEISEDDDKVITAVRHSPITTEQVPDA